MYAELAFFYIRRRHSLNGPVNFLHGKYVLYTEHDCIRPTSNYRSTDRVYLPTECHGLGTRTPSLSGLVLEHTRTPRRCTKEVNDSTSQIDRLHALYLKVANCIKSKMSAGYGYFGGEMFCCSMNCYGSIVFPLFIAIARAILGMLDCFASNFSSFRYGELRRLAKSQNQKKQVRVQFSIAAL